MGVDAAPYGSLKRSMKSTNNPVAAIAVPTANANARGLVYMALGFLLFASGDTIAKLLSDQLHPIQIVWFRQLGLMAAASVLLVVHGRSLLRTAFPLRQIARGALAVVSALSFVFGITYVPLADAVAVTFVAPFMVTIMGVIFLREQVGPRRWAAIVLGFIGAMIIIRPGLGVFHPAIFLVLAAAAFFAMRQVLSRALAGADRTQTTVIYTAVVSVALLTLPMPLVWRWPAGPSVYLLLLAMAVLAACGEIMVIRALEIAQAAVVAPVHYSLIIWATLYGWVIFGELPDFWTFLGTSIILLTGIYLIHRERVVRRRPAPGDR